MWEVGAVNQCDCHFAQWQGIVDDRSNGDGVAIGFRCKRGPRKVDDYDQVLVKKLEAHGIGRLNLASQLLTARRSTMLSRFPSRHGVIQ